MKFPESYGNPASNCAIHVAGEGDKRGFLLKRYTWDVFVCHAGPDKVFARMLQEAMLPHGLKCFVDEDSLPVTDDAQSAMDAAVRTTHIAVVLLCKEFFTRDAPQQELRTFLRNRARNKILPVVLGITWERCMELAEPKDLAAACKHTGVRHNIERDRFTGRPVDEEDTMNKIVERVLHLSGIKEAMV